MKGTWIGRFGSRLLGSLLAVMMFCVAGGQDFPTLKGDAVRTGKSSSFLSSGPGIAALTWYRPNFTDTVGKTQQLDNLMRATGTDPAYWTASGIWFGPTDPTDSNVTANLPTDLQNPPTGVSYSVAVSDASNTSPIVITTATPHNLFTGDQVSITGVLGNTAADNNWTITVLTPTTFSLNGSAGNGGYTGSGTVLDTSGYEFAECIASDKSGDPRTPLNASDTLSIWSWSLRNTVAPFYEAQNYAIYVYIPVGQTTVGGVQRFPQRDYVYEVDYTGGSFVDVINTDTSGGGWVRIGGHGGPTNQLFPSDGTAPITVKLYNTVPRDDSTGLLTTNSKSGSDDLDLSLPRPIVYADAVRAVPAIGFYAATPVVSTFTGAAGPTVRTVAALNQTSVGTLNGKQVTTQKGLVTSYVYNTGARSWQFSPLQESSLTAMLDNDSSGVTTTGVFSLPTAVDTTAANFRGSNYLSAATVGTLPGDAVEYAPTLNPASYDVYAWLPGDSNGEVFAHNLQYEIFEGGVETDIAVDQSGTGTALKGWVRIGTRSFKHDPALGNPLKVFVTNYSADPTDSTRLAYADAIRFVGPTNLTITATPIQTTSLVRMTRGAAPVSKPVVIVAAENGTIYCLDADGRGDGSTDILWTYPSTRDPDIPLPGPGQPDTWQDPNLNAPTGSNPDWGAIDGTNNQLIAQMPTGFGLSSPVIATISGQDYLFVASNNGRIYCLEMAGRGDMDIAHRKPGTTRRVWTYPDDYPATPVPSTLGASIGSVAVGTNTAGPTVFVPTMQGRMYALDAVGNAVNHTTTPRWTYPAISSPTLGPIAMTPAVDFNQVFFGTQSKDGSSPGQFLALNWDTGVLNWTMPNPTNPLTDFNGGPCTVDTVSLGSGMPDTVFCSNDNRGLYALDASNGTIEWETYEPSAAIRSPLTFTVANVFDFAGVQSPTEVLVAPQSDGIVSLWNAQTTNLNVASGRFAGGFTTQSQSLTDSAAVGWNFMYFGDNAGYLYALSNTAGGFPPNVTPPLQQIEAPNNPATADYRGANVKMIKKSAFLQLHQGTMYYADAIDPSNEVSRTPMAFEWGETIYLLIYHFPYQKSGVPSPPIVNVNFSAAGETVRNVFSEAQQFPDITDPNNDSSGYTVLQFTVQGAGANALPPGPGEVSIGFNTVDPTGAPVNYPSVNKKTVYIANPLALIVPGYGSSAPPQTIGNTNVTSDPENLTNGNGTGKPYILGTLGTLAHGQSSTIGVGVIDRSLVELLRGPGKGLQNVRVERNVLQWNHSTVAGAGAPLDPIDPTLFPGFEDTPVNYPNNSLDYPDIYAQSVSVTKNANGVTGNPVQYPVELVGPTAADGSLMTEDNDASRALLTTPFAFKLNVPLYQPANEMLGNDQNNPPPGTPSIPDGYSGLYYVFVDTSGDGILDRPNSFIQTDSQAPAANREAFRMFNLATSVSADRRIAVLTPTLDLGSLAEGVGYTPDPPGPSNPLFDPWTTQYSKLFKSFDVANEGNVNLLNLRVAKATTTDNSSYDAWQIFSPTNEDWAYLDGSVDLWSDMDPKFAPMRDIDPNGVVIGQKPRVGDRYPRNVTTNPFARANFNTGVVTDTPRLPTSSYPVQSPRVAVTLPIGFPVGTYVGLVRVIDDNAAGTDAAAMWQNVDANNNPTEPTSDPGLRITFKPREARVTSTASPLDAPFLDNLVSGADNFRYGNVQPAGFRDPNAGGLVVGYTSQRPVWAPATPTGAVVNAAWRIYLGSVRGTDPKTATGQSPLRDLNAFVPDDTNSRWFLQSPVTANGFPDPSLDANIWNGLIAGTAKYGSPEFPANGMLDPYRLPSAGMGTPFPNALMAFVGNARVSNGGVPTNESEIFVAPVTVDSTGAIGVGNVYAMTNDPTATKGRPSILQTQNGFVLFYAATVGGRSNIYYVMPSGTAGASQYDGSYFTDSSALNLGEGFESVSSPYVTGRLLRGGTNPAGAGSPIIELTFAGKLHGRPISEIYYGRIGMSNSLTPTSLLPLDVRTRETVFESTVAGTFLANGVQWNTNAPITLEVFRAGTYTDIEVPNTRQTERGTGIITFDTKLGGKAYIDPVAGTVRLSGAMPPHDSSLVLTYQPSLLRVSEGTAAGYASPSVAFDERFIPDITYWRRAGDSSPVDATDPVRTGRYLFSYGRAAAGSGQAARPMIKSMRLGLDLPYPVFTNSDGTTGAISVTASGGVPPLQYFQLDPAKKKIYFTADDEFKQVTVNYEAADPSTGADIGQKSITGVVDLIVERPEELMQLDQATDETNLSMFLDPFDYIDFRRPGLVWMLWSSTRAGAPDIYMQTIAPRFTPIITGK